MKTNRVKIFIMLVMLFSFGACSEDSSTNPTSSVPDLTEDPTTDPTPPAVDFQTIAINLFEAAKGVAPSFAETTTKAASELEDPMEYLFNTFRMFDPEIHQGIIDGSNFFRVLFDMDESLEDIFDITEAIDPVVIQEPFEFGNSITYDHAANTHEDEGTGNIYDSGYAYTLEGETIHFLVTYRISEDEGTHITMGQLQGSYDMEEGDVDLAMIYLVEYNGEEYYVVRNEIAGNELTHEFELRMAISGSHGGGSAIVGKGISQGENAFFLLKMNYGYELAEAGERYYVFPADADETFLQEMDREGLQYEDLPVEVADYQADIQSKALFVPADLPTGHVDFNDSDISLDF
ncbi:MAG: hypothetical protein KOO60_13350 [Gemmatimonadales bacterium]|nr:hypothetical protein [Gemmatimonadales bacterium]